MLNRIRVPVPLPGDVHALQNARKTNRLEWFLRFHPFPPQKRPSRATHDYKMFFRFILPTQRAAEKLGNLQKRMRPRDFHNFNHFHPQNGFLGRYKPHPQPIVSFYALDRVVSFYFAKKH